MSAQADPYAFVSMASYELRTPLASLQTTLELLRAELIIGATSFDRAAAHADRALRQTCRVVRLANDLLDLSRLDGDAALVLEPIELSELARTIPTAYEATDVRREVYEVLYPLWPERGPFAPNN